METQQFWRHDEAHKRGAFSTARATLGTGGQGSLCPVTTTVGAPLGAMRKTASMPIMGPTAPTGRRVGDDLAFDGAAAEMELPLTMRKAPLAPELEQRLSSLECSFHSGSLDRAGSQKNRTMGAWSSRASAGSQTPASRGLISSRSVRSMRSSLMTPASGADYWRNPAVSTPGSNRSVTPALPRSGSSSRLTSASLARLNS